MYLCVILKQHRKTHNRQSTHVSAHWISPLELAAIWHPVIHISACLLPMFKNIPFFTILPQHSSVTLLCFHLLLNSSNILATLKYVWLTLKLTWTKTWSLYVSQLTYIIGKVLHIQCLLIMWLLDCSDWILYYNLCSRTAEFAVGIHVTLSIYVLHSTLQ